MSLISTFSKFTLECGTDEAGRGCLAGPVTAAAVILPADFSSEILNDSKQLNKNQRNQLKIEIELNALAYAFSHVWPETIDQINILNASILAMHQAIEKLTVKPEFISVDGNRFKTFKNIPHETIVKGDGKYLNIAAASIIAKTERDSYMEKIHEEYPHYNWIQNKGYPTKEHRDALISFGPTPYHRQSFRLKPEQLKLDL
ncbi:ribonuclease HII [Aegicerativicinus sediminis]|uniref:ribonuclease HII n=1 Tax=Aegicerativicinus sediminis TaxID=2893202 RepID=UPI001E5885FC|nr:ribonuclease HII [Aegicerativicinus sediminis]